MLIPFDSLTQKYRFQPKGVLHIGANVGEERHAYHNMGVDKVIWIEANPEIFRKLERNLAHYPDQYALNYCIGDEEGKDVVFHVANNASQSSSILDLEIHTIKHPEVFYTADIKMKMKRIDHIDYDFSGLDFLNIDLQGCELMALKGMGDLLNQYKWLYLEVNEVHLYKDCVLINELDEFLSNYKRVETKWSGNHQWGDALYIRRDLV